MPQVKTKNSSAKDSATLGHFDKYFYYHESVQSPENDAQFFFETYKELRGKEPRIFREDFCGTFAQCCEWVKRHPENLAVGVDLDPEPIDYGKTHYLSQLDESQQRRIHIFQDDVIKIKAEPVDIIAALNFSYFIFKERETLKAYFKNCHAGLAKDGLFMLDCFGGSECHHPNEEETDHDDFSYFWDQDHYDPITHHALFYIHFKRKDEEKREKVFTYDWRMWGIAELRDILNEAGFSKTHVYWEGTGEDGEGNGEFTRREKGEECESWVAYIVAEK